MAAHLAAVAVTQGKHFEVQSRPTPKPGPGELLIEVKSVALNPADGIMRNLGLLISSYPAVIGFDVSGRVLEVGQDVPSSASFQPGTRVAAYASTVWDGPDFGVFQEKCLVRWQHAVPLPEDVSWNEAATLPVSVQVPLSIWDALGISRTAGAAASTTGDKMEKKEALLVWGASSSVGTMGVQTARLLRDGNSPFGAVYATAGAANHKYISSLGADRVFDYKETNVAHAIIFAAKEDGLVIRHCFLAMGDLASCQAVLKSFAGGDQKCLIGSAPPVPADAEVISGLETLFVQPAMTDEKARLAQFEYWFGTWLRENLANKTIRPSPEPKVVGKGLEAINAGIDTLMQGVSCSKLVVEISQ